MAVSVDGLKGSARRGRSYLQNCTEKLWKKHFRVDSKGNSTFFLPHSNQMK